MYPIIFEIPVFGGLPIYTYGVMVALGFIAAIFWVRYESKRLGQDPSKAVDLIFYIILAGIVGSRVLHVAVSERERFFNNPLILFNIREGGLVFYGGLLLSIVVGIWFIKKNKMPMLLVMDIFAPAVAIGHAIGRVGCLMVGCCYGSVVSHPAWYTITFSADKKPFAPTGVPLYPTQTMEIVGEVTIFLILFFLRRIKKFDGQIIAAYLILYSALRTATEFFRGDSERGFVFGGLISTSQFISMILFSAGIVMYIKLGKKGRNAV